MNDKTEAACALCQHRLAEHPIIDQALRFCCSGCQAVFSILSSKGETGNYLESPLFLHALHSGLISNPALIEQIRERAQTRSSEESLKFYCEIADMWCPSCAEVIRLTLLQNKGIKTCRIDYATDLAVIEFFPRYISKERIFQSINALGYIPKTLEEKSQTTLSKALYLRFSIAAFCSFNAMMFAYPLYATYLDGFTGSYNSLFAWISFFLMLPVVTYAGLPIFSRFWSSLTVGLVGMEALVTLGVFSAFLLSTVELLSGGTQVYFDSMSVIITFVLLGKIIESKAKFSAKEALFRLNLVLPKRGRKQLQEDTYQYVPLKDLVIGDLIEVRQGEMVVLDGTVNSGEGLCSEALMTGEPLPVSKKAGDRVIGGTTLQQGCLSISITATPNQSTLQQIVAIIEQQMHAKQAYTRPVDIIVRWFVPFIFLLAAVTATLCISLAISDDGKSVEQTAFLRVIAILLISCPCAIGIAAPTAESALIQALAACGAIVRNRGCLQFLGRETAFVFDKTGTITKGNFEVLNGLNQLSAVEKSILKALVKKSTHPIAFSICSALDCPSASLTSCEEIIGKGIRGVQGNHTYLLGSKRFLEDHGLIISNTLENQENQIIVTNVYFVVLMASSTQAEKVIPITLGDQLKADASQVIHGFNKKLTCLVSGDALECVSRTAALCGFKHWKAQASPLEKQQYIERLKKQKHIVSVIGDGINDSPALASAHIGISVATAADVSVQVSDILLTNDRLSTLPKLCFLAKKGRRILRQNLFWAFIYNFVGLALAACGWLSPIFAAFAMTASSTIVLLNAMRLKINDSNQE